MNFVLGDRVVVGTKRARFDYGRTGRVVGIMKDHFAPRQRVYVRFDDKPDVVVYSSQSLFPEKNNSTFIESE